MTCPCKFANASSSRGDRALRGPGLKRPHCVVDKHGDTVRCFRNKRTASGVAKKLGSGYKVKSG